MKYKTLIFAVSAALALLMAAIMAVIGAIEVIEAIDTTTIAVVTGGIITAFGIEDPMAH